MICATMLRVFVKNIIAVYSGGSVFIWSLAATLKELGVNSLLNRDGCERQERTIKNNIKLKWFGLLMNSGSSERERHCSKAKKFIRFVKADAGGFWGFFSKLLGFLRFGSSDKNALNTLLDDLELCYP